jgi:hypothetical protein
MPPASIPHSASKEESRRAFLSKYSYCRRDGRPNFSRSFSTTFRENSRGPCAESTLSARCAWRVSCSGRICFPKRPAPETNIRVGGRLLTVRTHGTGHPPSRPVPPPRSRRVRSDTSTRCWPCCSPAHIRQPSRCATRSVCSVPRRSIDPSC